MYVEVSTFSQHFVIAIENIFKTITLRVMPFHGITSYANIICAYKIKAIEN